MRSETCNEILMEKVAFYESDSSNLPMELSQLVSYLWLNQQKIS